MLILLCEFFLGSPLSAAFLGGQSAGAISVRMARFNTPYRKGWEAKPETRRQWAQ